MLRQFFDKKSKNIFEYTHIHSCVLRVTHAVFHNTKQIFFTMTAFTSLGENQFTLGVCFFSKWPIKTASHLAREISFFFFNSTIIVKIKFTPREKIPIVKHIEFKTFRVKKFTLYIGRVFVFRNINRITFWRLCYGNNWLIEFPLNTRCRI